MLKTIFYLSSYIICFPICVKVAKIEFYFLLRKCYEYLIYHNYVCPINITVTNFLYIIDTNTTVIAFFSELIEVHSWPTLLHLRIHAVL